MSNTRQKGGCSPLQVMTIKWFESTTTTKIKVMIDNIIKINKMEFIILITIVTIVKIAEKLAKIEE